MGSGVKVVIGLIMVAVLMIVFPIVMGATHDLQTVEQVDADLAITAGPPITVTLTETLWKARSSCVISMVGDNAGDVFVYSSYANKVLTVTCTPAVPVSTTMTVTYEVDGLTDYTGMGALVGITPLLIWIAVLATVIGGIWFAVKGRA